MTEPNAMTMGGASRAAREETWGEWLAPLDWHHCLTLTTARSQPPAVWRERWRVFHRNLERAAQQPVRFFWVLENVEKNRPHLHALLSGTENLTPKAIAAHWKHGRAEADPYDASRGWARYCTKTLGTARWDVFDMSKTLPKESVTLGHAYTGSKEHIARESESAPNRGERMDSTTILPGEITMTVACRRAKKSYTVFRDVVLRHEVEARQLPNTRWVVNEASLNAYLARQGSA